MSGRLREAVRSIRHEWAVRPMVETLFLVVILPLAIVAFYGAGRPSLILGYLSIYVMGWFAHRVWLSNGKVIQMTVEWRCETCQHRERAFDRAHSRATYAQHVREVHGIEITPDDLHERPCDD